MREHDERNPLIDDERRARLVGELKEPGR